MRDILLVGGHIGAAAALAMLDGAGDDILGGYRRGAEIILENDMICDPMSIYAYGARRPMSKRDIEDARKRAAHEQHLRDEDVRLNSTYGEQMLKAAADKRARRAAARKS